MRRKIEAGIDQEINFCQQLLSGQRVIPNLAGQHIAKWLFVIMLTDPFPSWEILIEPLRQRLASAVDLGNAQLHRPFILSLSELEQPETLPEKRGSELLIEWEMGGNVAGPFTRSTRTVLKANLFPTSMLRA